jgi:radical SAM superfamily enzyme YgiQ (UPF0313 family)
MPLKKITRFSNTKIQPQDRLKSPRAMAQAAGRDPGGRLSVLLVYLGPESEGLSCLALHGLYQMVNAYPNTLAERLFYDTSRWPFKPRSLESGRHVDDFELVALTVPFEEHAARLGAFMRSAGMPPKRTERTGNHPVVLAGGIAVRLAPLLFVPFVDLLVPGDAERTLPAILEILAEGQKLKRRNLLEKLATVPGVLVPECNNRIPQRVSTLAKTEGSCQPIAQVFSNAKTHFQDMFLVETSRGCPAGCRFCAIGFSRRPACFFSASQILSAARPGIESNQRIGLVGASLAWHPELSVIIDGLAGCGADLSPASLDPHTLAGPSGPALIAHLVRGGNRTVTLGLETGSERLGRVINKTTSQETLEFAVRRLGEAGILNLKLYFMYGLPTEHDQDLQATLDLVGRVQQWLLSGHRKKGRTGQITVSINPFVPKPHTPFEREALLPIKELLRRRNLLEGGLRRFGGLTLSGESPRRAVLQCLLDRVDERFADLLLATGKEWPPPHSILETFIPDWEKLVFEPWPVDREPPWRIVDTGVDPDYLERERKRAYDELPTPACQIGVCRECGAC